jgi:type VI secretion system protein ImpH
VRSDARARIAPISRAEGLSELTALAARAREIPFVALVEHLARLFGTRVGEAALVRDEPIRFRHDPSLIFHTGDVASMEVRDGVVEVTSTFLGATGAVSPLAAFFTEDLLRADAADGPTLGAFYDLLHHRLLALTFRALARRRPVFGVSRAGNDPLTVRALATLGLGPKRADAPLSTLALLGRGRLLARRPRGREALEQALALAFPRLRVAVADFVERRVSLPREQRFSLGRANHALGRETRLGRHRQAQSDRIRLRLGPVDRPAFERLLPGGPDHRALLRVVREITGGLLDVEVELEVLRGEEPRASLGNPGRRSASGAALGRSALVLTSRKDRRVLTRFSLTETDETARPRYFRE